MTAACGGERGQPESVPPGAVLEVLTRWEQFGGHWKVLAAGEEWIEVGLFTCDGGEQMNRIHGAPTPALRSFLAGRTSSAD